MQDYNIEIYSENCFAYCDCFGRWHKEDGPAYFDSTGYNYILYAIKNKAERYDGPAEIIIETNAVRYYADGICVSENDFFKRIEK